jgi:hypothetical protein
LEGKDVKDLLLNVGSGGGAAAPAAGGAAAGGDAGGADAAKEEEKKEEGMQSFDITRPIQLTRNREGRVGRRYGFRSFRLNNCIYVMTGVLGVLYTTYGGLSKPLIDQANLFPLLLNQESIQMSL